MAGEENNNGSGGAGAGEGAGAGAGEGAGAQPITAIPIADLKAAGIGDAYFDDKGNLNAKSIAEQLAERGTLKAAAEERAKLIPADGKYIFDLPKDFKLPEGVGEWKPDPTFTGELAAAFKEAGLTQAEVNKLIPVYAQNQIRQITAAREATKVEMAKLGAEPEKRLETIGNAAIAALGEKLGRAIINSDAMSNAETVLELEKFINTNGARLASNLNPGAGGNNNAELAAQVGKPGGGRKLLEAANAAKK